MVEARIKRFGLGVKAGRDFDLVNPEDDPRYRSYVQSYIDVAGRRGVTPDAARTVVRTNNTVIAALAVTRGEADAMICGVEGRYMSHLRHVRDIIGHLPEVSDFAALALMITSKGAYFIADTEVRSNPSADELCEVAALAAQARAALQPQAEDRLPVAFRFRQLRHRLLAQDAASATLLSEAASPGAGGRRRDAGRHRAVGSDAQAGPAAFGSPGEANILMMPNLDAANIAYQMVKVLADAVPVGPILIGPARPAHILTPSVTARGILNMTAVAAVEAQERATRQQPSVHMHDPDPQAVFSAKCGAVFRQTRRVCGDHAQTKNAR